MGLDFHDTEEIAVSIFVGPGGKCPVARRLPARQDAPARSAPIAACYDNLLSGQVRRLHGSAARSEAFGYFALAAR